MTTEVGDETAKKASSRKRKQTSEETTVERKTNPRRAAKTKAEEAKAAAAAATTSSTSKTKAPGTSKKAKTEKTDAGPSLPTSKNFLAHAQELKLVISYPVTDKEEDEHEEDTSKKEGTDEEKEKTKEEAKSTKSTAKNGDSVEDITPTEDEPLYTLTAKPHKNATGSYGWTASVPKGKIKVDIEGEEVELPVTISLNITVQGSKK